VDIEPRAWLAAIPSDELDRDWQRVRSSMAVTFVHEGADPSQRAGDLVFYCGADSGVLAGVVEITGTSESSRLTVIPELVLDRARAPSIADSGLDRPGRHTRLDRDAYVRLRELVLSAAVPLDAAEGASATSEAAAPSKSAPTAWLAPVPDSDLDSGWPRMMERVAITLDASSVPTLQQVGDLVVYCVADTGVLAGVGEVVGEPRVAGAGPTQWRLKILPRLLLDRARSPSVREAGMSPRRLQTHLEPGPYQRLRELIVSVALTR
jgi:hypothetical protein